MTKLKKALLTTTIIIIALVVSVIVFISPFTKYLIEKYDEKYTGRTIKIGWAYTNPFTGYIQLNNLKIYELKSDSIFLSAKSLSVNISLLKLFYGTYEISAIELDTPKGYIIQDKHKLNFTDLIDLFSSDSLVKEVKAPVHFNILKIKITNGEFYYKEKNIPINYFIKAVNMESEGKHWDIDTIPINFSFLPGIGTGTINGDINIDLKKLNYNFRLVVKKLDLNIINQYLKDLTNYGVFSANADANIVSSGNFTDQENVTVKGLLAINDLHFGKNVGDDYASFEKFTLAIKDLSPLKFKYLYDSISIIHPYFKYERYDYLDNIQTMFGQDGKNIVAADADGSQFNLVIEIAKYIKVLTKNFLRSNYKIDRFALYNGDFQYNDFSISEKFAIQLNPLYIKADSVDRTKKTIGVLVKSNVKPFGNVFFDLVLNPKIVGDFNLQYYMKNLSVAMFNPYTITYTSFPLDRGTIELNGNWKMKGGNLQSTNHVLIIDPRVSKKIRNKNNSWIPLPLIMSFIQERGNVIDYEIPITGDLKSPKFHFRDAIFDLLENIFVKPSTTPYRIKVNNLEREIEKSLTVKWDMNSSKLNSNQEKFLKKMARFLSENSSSSITVYQQQYQLKEKEYLLFYEAKKKYLQQINKNVKFTKQDSNRVIKMSIKDSLFVHYISNYTKDSLQFTIQEKCMKFIEKNIVDTQYKQLIEKRKQIFLSFFKDKGVIKQVKIMSVENLIPYNGFSYYKIEYNNKFPEYLINAYEKMNEFNQEFPRKPFKELRTTGNSK